MLILDRNSGAIVFSATQEHSGARWSLLHNDRPLAALDRSNLSLLYQGPVNRVGGADEKANAPWSLLTKEGMYPLPSNISPEWMVPGERTFYIQSEPEDAAPEGALAAVYADAFEGEFIPVQPGSLIHFAAYCALHRASGYMEIEFYNGDKATLSEAGHLSAPELRRAVIGPGKLGGTSLLNYDRCQISAAVPLEARFAQLRFIMHGEVGQVDRFLFFVCPYLGYMAPPLDLSGTDLAVERNYLPGLFSEYKAKLFLYSTHPPFSIFDGSTASLRVEQEVQGRSRTIGFAEITFPRIIGVEIFDASTRSIFGRVLADPVSCASVPLALCRADKKVISRTLATCGQGGYLFEFVVPQDPFDEVSRSFSIFDGTLTTRLLDFALAA